MYSIIYCAPRRDSCEGDSAVLNKASLSIRDDKLTYGPSVTAVNLTTATFIDQLTRRKTQLHAHETIHISTSPTLQRQFVCFNPR